MIYLFIFISKIAEIALGTLRMIVVANGKKWLGAILQVAHAVVWVTATGAVIVGIQKDFLKIIVFALGSFIGSYVGCWIEEKLALGSNMILCITEAGQTELLEHLRNSGFAVTVIACSGMESIKEIYLIVTPRKKKQYIVEILEQYDSDCMILSENTIPVHGGYST